MGNKGEDLPPEALVEVDKLIDHLNRRLDAGADRILLSEAAIAVARAFAEVSVRRAQH